MKEIAGIYQGYRYDTSFVSDGHKTICVFAITWRGEIIDVRSDVLPLELEVAEEEAAIHARIRAHIDTLVRDSG